MSRVHFFEKSPTIRIKSSRLEFLISGFVDQNIKPDTLILKIGEEVLVPFEAGLRILLPIENEEETFKILNTGFIFKFFLSLNSSQRLNLVIQYNDLVNNSHSHSFNHITMVEKSLTIEAQLENEIAICMPTYNPDMALMTRQIESIKNQSYTKWKLIIQDDGSEDSIYEKIEDLVSDVNNITISKNDFNLGFYQNYELLLNRIGKSFSFVALADQDDIWDSDKLKTCVAHLNEEAQIVYSDLSIISDDNKKVIQKSFWENRSNHYKDSDALCLNNTATGSTMLIKRNWLETALPFPQKVGRVFHDHWLAYFARANNSLQYLDKVLVQYVQHDKNETGFKPFESPNLWSRFLSNFSMIVILLKIVCKRDLSREAEFIRIYQEVYFLQLQRMKQFYERSRDPESIESLKISNNFILRKLLKVAFKGYFSTWYFNRYDKHIYSSILLQKALKYRSYFHKN